MEEINLEIKSQAQIIPGALYFPNILRYFPNLFVS